MKDGLRNYIHKLLPFHQCRFCDRNRAYKSHYNLMQQARWFAIQKEYGQPHMNKWLCPMRFLR